MTDSRRNSRLTPVLLMSIIAIAGSSSPATTDESPATTFTGPGVHDVRNELQQWITQTVPDTKIGDEIFAPWSDDDRLTQLSREELLDQLIETFAAVDSTTQKLVESTWGAGPLQDVVYDGIREIPVYRNQVELYRARWLVQHRYFDEALAIYEPLSPDEVVDPAGLFFYRAICQSELLQRDAALDSLSLLLDHTLDVPSRFRTVATILRKELNARKDKGLEQVSQMMSDVHRRLDLGRSGEQVQKREKRVIDAIDELLEDLEKQKKKQQQSGGQGQQGRSPQSGRPAGRGSLQGIAGDGEAERKDIKETGGWGMLDRRKEAKVRELIQQQLPASYLDIISEYSRKIAEQE